MLEANMRRIWWSCVAFSASLGLAATGSFDQNSILAGQDVATLRANSVWNGTCGQTDTNSPYPMVLVIRERRDDRFEGVTYYPTLGNALLKVTGQIDANGK